LEAGAVVVAGMATKLGMNRVAAVAAVVPTILLSSKLVT
jgi:hypothetical protein